MCVSCIFNCVSATAFMPIVHIVREVMVCNGSVDLNLITAK